MVILTSRDTNPSRKAAHLSIEFKREYGCQMDDGRLEQALANLVSRGELNQEDAHKVRAEFDKSAPLEESKSKVISEIGGYLGGLFIFIALLILIGGRWHHISRYLQFSLFLTVALLLAAVSFTIGKSTPARGRVVGLLGVASACSTTAGIFSWRISGDGPIFFALFVGWLLTLGSYIWNRTAVGEIALAGFSLAAGSAGTFLAFHHFRGMHELALVSVIIGSLWLLLSALAFFSKLLGSAIAMVFLFLGGQFFFSANSHLFTYLICLLTVVVAAWMYARSPEWPLLVGAIASITVGMGELVGATLGGSLGATLGLLTSGVIFVGASAYSFKRSKWSRSD